MSKIIRLTSEKELRAIHSEAFINNSNKVNKVSDHSVLSGIISGNTKTAKKALKDISLAMSHLFPDTAIGDYLDSIADKNGIAPRLGASQSSTYIRVVGQPGTLYEQGVHTVSTNSGLIFDLEEDLAISSKGYGYLKIRSQESGDYTNVDPFTIVNISPVPSGHIGVINEYKAIGGRDLEQDDLFRKRIKEGPNILAKGTIDYLTQVLIKINSNVLRVIYDGISSQGKITLSILTQNGITLTQNELDELLDQCSPFLSLTELNPVGTGSVGVILQNVTYQPIDISCRLDLYNNAEFTSTIKDIQVSLSKLVDYRFWEGSRLKVEFEELLEIVGNHKNVKSVPDKFFTPNTDVVVKRGQFPRFRGFEAKDLAGNLIINQSGTLDPIFYPNIEDVSFQLTVL